MNSKDLFRMPSAEEYLASDVARLSLIQANPGYLTPTLSHSQVLRLRLVLDQRHDTGGGQTEIFAVYEGGSDTPGLLRYVKLARGPFGRFNLDNGCKVHDTVLKQKVLSNIEREFRTERIPEIADGSDELTNTNYVEAEWFFKGTSRQVSWDVPNNRLKTLENKSRKWAETFRKLTEN